jgi:hypothetical protein
MSHLKNNLCIYFIIFSALLSIVSIIAGAAMLKTDQYDNPFLVIVAVSNLCWFFFVLFAKNLKQEENIMENRKIAEKTYNQIYVYLLRMLAVALFMTIVLIFLTNVSMGIIITLKVFITYSGYIY